MGPTRIACAAIAATMLAACARTENTADTTAANARVDSATTTTHTTADTAKTATSSGLATSSGAPGRHLTDANGRTVYMFVHDKKNVSTCTAACAAAWPPFSSGSTATTDSAVKSAMVGTITRSDNRNQTTYNGMPLYYYEDDKKAGDTKGQGKNEFGGLWYVVSPGGKRLVK
jgi:predicted lipoprotein with Yx(FWY)xxD motif